MANVAFILCGALAREVAHIIERHNWSVDLFGIPALDHMYPERIAPDVAHRLLEIRNTYKHVLVVFGDCGTRGTLDDFLDEQNLERLEGPHCYEMYGGDTFHEAMEEQPGTFFLTDFLVRGFDGTVWRGMGLDKYPQLKDEYFKHYTRLLYLAQTNDPKLVNQAEAIAKRLDLPLEIRFTGYNLLEERLISWMTRHAPESIAAST